MDNRERLHHSLPALDIECLPEMRHSPQKKKKGRQSEDEALAYIMSAFYAKILVIIGTAFSITRSITTSGNMQHDIFFIYLYTGSIIFFLYMYMIHSRAKYILYEIYNGTYRGPSELTETYKNKLYVRYGSFYFRIGVVGFGVGSLIYSALKLGEYFEISYNCANVLRAIKPATRMGFILSQMVFIFSFSNFLAVQKSQLIAKFGLMHLIATNISDWFQVLIEETVRDIIDSILLRQKNYHQNATTYTSDFFNTETKLLNAIDQKRISTHNCKTFKIVTPILIRIGPHLSSCAVEYNVLCTMILLLMWRNSTSKQEEEASRDLSTEISRQSGSNTIYGRSQSQFSIDCAQTQRGLFSGILVLAVTIISLILFFELIHRQDYATVALLQMNVWEFILFFISTVTVILCFISLRDVTIINQHQELQLEHLLLLVTQYGVFVYFLFQILSCYLMGNTDLGGIIRIITPLLALIQSSLQTAFILDAWRRRCSNEWQIRQKPGRQLITFLLLMNVSLWFINRVKNNKSAFHPNQMNFYGILSWNIITHVSMPLVVSYRFQATVCFYEIWKHVYKRPIKPNLNGHQNQETHP